MYAISVEIYTVHLDRIGSFSRITIIIRVMVSVRVLLFLCVGVPLLFSLQCFDTVGWATGRASGL